MYVIHVYCNVCVWPSSLALVQLLQLVLWEIISSCYELQRYVCIMWCDIDKYNKGHAICLASLFCKHNNLSIMNHALGPSTGRGSKHNTCKTNTMRTQEILRQSKCMFAHHVWLIKFSNVQFINTWNIVSITYWLSKLLPKAHINASIINHVS